jgi:hypothetical protein
MRPKFLSLWPCALALCGLVWAQGARASNETPRFGVIEANASPVTLHFTPSDEHKNVWLLGVSKVQDDGTVVSGAVFGNSFGQPCATVQYGQRYLRPFGRDGWYWQWTVGPVYGYVAPYNHKVPLNYKGLSPVVIPSAGVQLTAKLSAQFTLLGNSALMLQFAYNLPDQ